MVFSTVGSIIPSIVNHFILCNYEIYDTICVIENMIPAEIERVI